LYLFFQDKLLELLEGQRTN